MTAQRRENATRRVRLLQATPVRFLLLYAGYVLLFAGWASLKIEAADLLERLVLSGSPLAAALALFSIYALSVRLSSSPKARRQALFVIPISLATLCLCLLAAEGALSLLPPQYSEIQKQLQLQLARRGTSSQTTHRGVVQSSSFNTWGWADEDWQWQATEEPLVFIGDSFLEVRSSRNLASRTEELLRQPLINLSKGGTGPSYYRFLLREVALPLSPRHVFVFLYEANDLFPSFRHSEYRHPCIRATAEAIRELGDRSEAAASLRRVADNRRCFTSREALLAELDDGLSPNDQYLAYLATYAYSTETSQMGPLLPRTTRRVTGWLTEARRLFCAFLWRTPESTWRDWRDFYPEYEAVYDLPAEQRLEAIARVISRRYLGSSDHRQCLEVLESQDQELKGVLIEEADMIYYLLPAVARAIRGRQAGRDGEPAAEASRRGCDPLNQYVQLFREMDRRVRDAGGRLTLVMIPEASYGDAAFRSFWLPMIDFNQHFARKHGLYLELRDELARDMEVIDLLRYRSELNHGYWRFDGHFNEKGNSVVARILASYLEDGLTSDPTPPPAAAGSRGAE